MHELVGKGLEIALRLTKISVSTEQAWWGLFTQNLPNDLRMFSRLSYVCVSTLSFRQPVQVKDAEAAP